jgi:glycosyltransferase involved in cell wall biosynthesis
LMLVMSPLRILQVAHDHPDWTPGGTELVAHDLTAALNAVPGLSARFLAAGTRLHRPEAIPGELSAKGPDFVLTTGAYDRFTLLRQDGAAWVGALARLMDQVQPDIVHLHGLDRIGAEVVPALRRIAPAVRIVLTLHDYQLICPQEGLMLTHPEGALCPAATPDRCHRCVPDIAAARHALRKAHLQAVLAQVDLMVAPSRFLRDRFVAWGVDAARIRVIGNAVPLLAAANNAPPRHRRNRFAMFGNMSRHKGVLVALDAAARCKAAGADLRLALHGSLGWAEEEFRNDFATALQASAPLAQHLGPYQRADLARLMQQVDWVLVPSVWWENAPLVVLEAQAMGLPVVCSGIGGMAELVQNGIDGLHVPAGDAAALAEAMVMAAADTDLWSRLASAAPHRTQATHVAEHVALYQGLLSRVAA